jgi:cell division topological specificity factor
MRFLEYFRKETNNSAAIAKDRLQIIVAHERSHKSEPDYLPKLQQELLQVISRYISVDLDDIDVQIEKLNECSVLELNITLPETV